MATEVILESLNTTTINQMYRKIIHKHFKRNEVSSNNLLLLKEQLKLYNIYFKSSKCGGGKYARNLVTNFQPYKIVQYLNIQSRIVL
jgi:hypothetical protein